MTVVSSTELPRTFENELGTPARAVRRFALVLSDNTLANNPLNVTQAMEAIGIDEFGVIHPDHSALKVRKFTITERFGDSPYHAEAVVEYTPIPINELLIPTDRKADWVFESQPGQLAALRYFHGGGSAGEGTGNDDTRPLVNTANDFFEGLTTEENMVRITVRKNFASFPAARLGKTNHLNNAVYATCGVHTLKCVGVNADFTQEVFNNEEYNYWATEIVVQFRQSGWPLQIPNVGFNAIVGNVKRRAMVFDFENSEFVASPAPVALFINGSQNITGQPAILTRRVNPDTSFQDLLGTPPTDDGWPDNGL